MKKFYTAFALLLALSLTACGTDPVKVMGTAEVTYTRLVNKADDIAQLPRCGTADGAAICVDQAAVDDMVAAAEVGDAALDEGWAAIAKYEGGGETAEATIDATVSAALGAVSVLERIINSFVKE